MRNRYSDHPSISIQLTHPFTHAFIDFSMLFIQSHIRNITSGDISIKMSPVVTFPNRIAFQPVLLCNNQCETDTQIIPPSQSSWHIHLHTWIHSLPASYSFNHNRNITKWWHFSKNVTSRDIFTLEGNSAFLLCNNQCETDTQIIPPSQSSWHIHSHKHSFTSACYSFNHNRNITSGDI